MSPPGRDAVPRSTRAWQQGRVTRRGLLAGLGAVGAGVVVADGPADAQEPAQQVPFRGDRQAGIVTSQQDRLVFATFDITTTDRAELADLLRTWSAAAEAMTQGKPVPGQADTGDAPPPDTGEAAGLPPARLTVTLGYGPTLFDERFGLAARKPAALAPLPSLPLDHLDPARTGGDVCVQACADDPQVAFHAIRNLSRLGFGTAVLRWMELGFGRTSSTTGAQTTPRNLMGFKDGTRNLRAGQTDLLDRYVWAGADSDQPWLRGGTYLVARRIRMLIEQWDRDSLQDQENVFGRHKDTGAPLTGSDEFDTPEFTARTGDGDQVIADDAHIRLASPENNDGLRILRRGYSFTDGIDATTGELMAGLFFIAFVRDPQQFITLQRKLGKNDALSEYIKHTGGGLFACPPGLGPGRHWGQELFS
jgi:deferrochelatase/peroxidase EfeB